MIETPEFIPGRIAHEITEALLGAPCRGFNPQELLFLSDRLKPVVIIDRETPHVETWGLDYYDWPSAAI